MFMRTFYEHRSQKHKKTDNLTVFFMLLGHARAKAARKMLMKLTSGVNFINVLHKACMQVDPKSANMIVKVMIILH